MGFNSGLKGLTLSCLSFCPYTRMEQLGSRWADFNEITFKDFSKIYPENSSSIKIGQE
jgi:hypothetical protein